MSPSRSSIRSGLPLAAAAVAACVILLSTTASAVTTRSTPAMCITDGSCSDLKDSRTPGTVIGQVCRELYTVVDDGESINTIGLRLTLTLRPGYTLSRFAQSPVNLVLTEALPGAGADSLFCKGPLDRFVLPLSGGNVTNARLQWMNATAAVGTTTTTSSSSSSSSSTDAKMGAEARYVLDWSTPYVYPAVPANGTTIDAEAGATPLDAYIMGAANCTYATAISDIIQVQFNGPSGTNGTAFAHSNGCGMQGASGSLCWSSEAGAVLGSCWKLECCRGSCGGDWSPMCPFVSDSCREQREVAEACPCTCRPCPDRDPLCRFVSQEVCQIHADVASACPCACGAGPAQASSCPAVPAGFTFVPGKDSSAPVLRRLNTTSSNTSTIAAVAAACRADSSCVAFNSRGHLKAGAVPTVEPAGASDPCDGLYVLADRDGQSPSKPKPSWTPPPAPSSNSTLPKPASGESQVFMSSFTTINQLPYAKFGYEVGAAANLDYALSFTLDGNKPAVITTVGFALTSKNDTVKPVPIAPTPDHWLSIISANGTLMCTYNEYSAMPTRDDGRFEARFDAYVYTVKKPSNTCILTPNQKYWITLKGHALADNPALVLVACNASVRGLSQFTDKGITYATRESGSSDVFEPLLHSVGDSICIQVTGYLVE